MPAPFDTFTALKHPTPGPCYRRNWLRCTAHRTWWIRPFVLALGLLLCAAAALLARDNPSSYRIKDITTVGGIRDNQLVGYGLVTGLAGNGDGKLDYTTGSLSNVLKNFDINVNPDAIKSKNIASVMLTANIGPFAKEGTRIDVSVSSVGDAKSLQGGVLLQAPLKGADGKVYAVAQGPISVGGFWAGADGSGGASVQKNHPTVGMISGGAIVEREIEHEVDHSGGIELHLRNPDFTTAVQMADAVNRIYPGHAMANNASSVNVHIPKKFQGQATNFISMLGQIETRADTTAKVTINPRTGTIVATNVRILPVAVSQGSLTITVTSNPNVSQANAFAEGGETVVTDSTQTNIDEVEGGFTVINDFPSIERFAAAMNALGVSVREVIPIIEAIKQAGALNAELVYI